MDLLGNQPIDDVIKKYKKCKKKKVKKEKENFELATLKIEKRKLCDRNKGEFYGDI